MLLNQKLTHSEVMCNCDCVWLHKRCKPYNFAHVHFLQGKLNLWTISLPPGLSFCFVNKCLDKAKNRLKDSGIRSEAHGYSDRGSGSDVTTTAYKGRGALPTETVVPKPQSSAKDHWWPIATHGWRRQVLVRLEVLHHDHSDHPDSHTSARDFTLGPIQIRPSACTVILKLVYSFRTLLNQPGSEIKLR